MGFTLERVVPWGRSLCEYIDMFNLSEADLRGRILGCGDGPASFNASLTRQGANVVSVDPLYRFSEEDIRNRIEETHEEVMAQTAKNIHEFVWTSITSLEELGQIRGSAMECFLSDYSQGVIDGRYVEGELPSLSFATGQFDLALCSHLLFLYSELLSEEFHLSSIREMCRVATEVRIFPLLELGALKSRHVGVVVSKLRAEGYTVDIVPVPYEFQKGGNEMMTERHMEQTVLSDCGERAG